MKCFVLMPYASKFDAVFAAVQAAVAAALPADQCECFWLKDHLAAGRITDDIVNALERCVFCIADVSGNNPNVMWETGYAMALGKPTILIGQSVDALPFDLKVHRVLEYVPEGLDRLVEGLKKAVQQTLARYELHTRIDHAIRPLNRSRTIAVTGTMGADTARTQRRIETTLEPYLERGATWYCGGVGTTDDLVAEYLTTRGEQVVAVGYNRYDFSPAIRKLIATNKISAVDASVENLPKGLAGPSQRDVLFASKAELIILFWDGKSRGTEELLEFFKANAVNTVIGFI